MLFRRRCAFFLTSISLLLLPIFVYSLLSEAWADSETAESRVEEELTLPPITITANPLNLSLFQHTEAVNTLDKSQINEKSALSLGETLKNEPGLSSSYFGPASSRPIIRANAGERIRILRNGIGTLDASNTAEDHQLTINPLLAEGVEILRGPESILYGGSAIGGIVNVVDGSIPQKVPETPQGEFIFKTESANEELSGAFKLETEALGLAWHFSALHQNSDDIQVPGILASNQYRETNSDTNPLLANDTMLTQGSLPNSDSRNRTGTIGASRIFEDGFFGLALSSYGSFYGVPGSETDIINLSQKTRSTIEIEQWKIDSRSELKNISDSIEKISFSSSFSNYDHKEIGDGEVLARFENNALEGRFEVIHAPVSALFLPEFFGTVGSQIEYSEFSAIGDSIFIPGSNRLAPSLFAYQETELIPKLLSFKLGERLEMTDISPEGEFESRRFFPLALSTGLSWNINGRSDYVAEATLTFAERSPSATELYADGIHFGRRIAEKGFSGLSKERSTGVDISIKKNTGLVTGGATFFGQEFSNYINLSSTGNRIDTFPEFAYTETRARMLGFELETSLMLSDLIDSYEHTLALSGQLDFVRGRDLGNGGNLPRIPPLKNILSLRYEWSDNITAKTEFILVATQNQTGQGELPTDAYQMLNIYLDTKAPFISSPKVRLFARGTNLTNEEGRVHMSFIKDLAPLPGRSFVAGLRGTF
ncbi:MAG TPA: TonB-dependent receptor [Oligoflexia bacterium]|nr:TonB-dependent receptor [Oligoflexia bacterium]HMP48135.1 TonB-dependent receptor [Oligoflexia bacterium]